MKQGTRVMENLQEFASSSNGDRWYLGKDEASLRTFVLHKANEASGGKETRSDVQAFLNSDSRGPEREALIAMLGVSDDVGDTEQDSYSPSA
jgi:hypothetical protein